MVSGLMLAACLFLFACQTPAISPDSRNGSALQLSTLLTDTLGMATCLELDTLDPTLLPPAVLDSLPGNFPQDPILRVLRLTGSHDTLFLVRFQQGGVYLFQSDGHVWGQGQLTSPGPGDVEAFFHLLFQTLFAHHPIKEVEWKGYIPGGGKWEVEFFDDSEWYVTLQGNQLCYALDDHGGHDGDDGYDDDDSTYHSGGSHSGYFGGHVPSGQVPDSLWHWLDQHDPGAEIDEIKYISLCDTVYGFVVKLENSHSGGSHGGDRYLVFAPDGTYLYKFREEDADEVLPNSLHDSLEALYPGFEPDDVMVQTLPSGDIRYEVEMKADRGGDDLFVLVLPDGTVLCERDETD